MRHRTDSTATLPRWLLAARSRHLVIKRGGRTFRWHAARAPLLKSILRAFVAAGLLAAGARDARAAFAEPPISAQAAAMGGASLSNPGDCAALFLNPAVGAGLRSPEAYFMYNQLYAGLSGVGSIGQGFAAVGVPTRVGTVQVGFNNLQASGLLEERVLGVTFARRWLDAVSAGVTGKYLHHRYLIGSDPAAAADPVFHRGTARAALALDAGLSVAVAKPLQVGLAVRNINQPDVGLAAADRVPREFQAGLAYDVAPWALRLTADYTYRDAQAGTLQDRSRPGVGLEKGYAGDKVKLRLGASLDQFSAGVGIQFGRWGLDYAILMSRTLLADSAGTHMVGLRYRFGEATPSSSRGDR
jgi:hypothetical protein